MKAKTDNFDTSPEYLANCDRCHDLGFSQGLKGLAFNTKGMFGAYKTMYASGYRKGKAARLSVVA